MLGGWVGDWVAGWLVGWLAGWRCHRLSLASYLKARVEKEVLGFEVAVVDSVVVGKLQG